MTANSLFVQAANGEMAANRVFAPNGKLQIANCKLENVNCKLENGKWKMENPHCFLAFLIFRFFRTFFHKLTLIEENKTEKALQVLAEIKAEIKRKD